MPFCLVATKKVVAGRPKEDLRGHEAATGTETEPETATGLVADTIAVMPEAAELQRLSVLEIVSATGSGDGADGGQQVAVAEAAAVLTANAAAGCHNNHRHRCVATWSPAQPPTVQQCGPCSVVGQRTMVTKVSNRQRMTDHQVSLVEVAPRSPHILRQPPGPRTSGPQVFGTQTQSQKGHLCLHSPCPLRARLRQGISLRWTKMPNCIRRLDQNERLGHRTLSTNVRSGSRRHQPSR